MLHRNGLYLELTKEKSSECVEENASSQPSFYHFTEIVESRMYISSEISGSILEI